jgi:hypothetical protein
MICTLKGCSSLAIKEQVMVAATRSRQIVHDRFVLQHEDEYGISPLVVPCLIEFVVEYWFTPGEKMVRYFRDGSGHPGSPPEIEWKATATKAEGENGEILMSPELKEIVGDWFARNFQNNEIILERIGEHANDE